MTPLTFVDYTTSDEFVRFSDGFWHIAAESQRKGHPAPFPEELIERLIKFYTYRGNVILDMFGGTGTVAAVAAKTQRRFIHMDISAEYCKITRYFEVQAAHIIPRGQRGPNHPRNGIALCRIHHWAFDHGVISVDSNDLMVLVAEYPLREKQNRRCEH
ncbi:MAG: DNA methyltransferase [Abditibacteriales bacterium]|nr:DNA methyltransferase [Abditibacteriales bacterium]MDW8366504.1 DNA methyltransferase [Abditibacteriales bacterium]